MKRFDLSRSPGLAEGKGPWPRSEIQRPDSSIFCSGTSRPEREVEEVLHIPGAAIGLRDRRISLGIRLIPLFDIKEAVGVVLTFRVLFQPS